MTNSYRRTLAATLLATTTLAAPSYAQTAETPPSAERPPAEQTNALPDDRDDIVVTAQKREENVQDVPISIQAIGTRKLDQLNISNFNQYTQLLPSVAFQTAQPGVTTVYMRGVASGGDGNHSGSLPSVGSYLDEQPVTTIGGTLDVHIYDIARIESLAGPQGTLYGASSQAGTIRIITNKPDTAGFYGRVDGELNTVRKGGMGGKIEGMINTPFSDRVALRVVGFYQRDAGFIDNVPGTRSFLPQPGGITVNNDQFVEKDYNDTEIWGGRAALKIDLDDTWTVTPTVLYQDTRSNGSYAFDPLVGDLQVQRFYPEYRRDRFIQGALTIEGQLGNWDVTYAGAYLDRKAAQSSDYTDYSEAYDSLYSSVGGLAGYFYYQDAAGNTIDPRQNVLSTDHFRKLSQELRVASPQDQPFRVVAGAFYQRQSNLIHQDYQIPNLGPNVSVNGFPGTLWLTQQKRVDKDYAMFGEASFDLTPTLTVTGGGRAYIYDNSLIGFFGFGRNPGNGFSDSPPNAAGSNRTGVAQCYTTALERLYDRDTDTYSSSLTLLPPAVSGSPCTNLGTLAGNKIVPVRTQGQGVTYRANITWKPVEDVLLYGTWSRGFRPGGINRRADVAAYDADFLTNYEIGWKTTLLDGKLRFNGAVYQQAWDAFQFSFLGENSFTVIQNGPNARIRGIEMDANLGVGPLTLTASGSYTDAKTRQGLCEQDVCGRPGAGDLLAPEGTRLPITPRFKINGTARYTVPIGTARGYVQGLVAHQSSASSDIRVEKAAALGRLKQYTSANASIGVEFTNFNLEAFVQNIWDERGQLTRFQQCGACDQRIYILPIQPRTIGIRAGAKF
ncbi:TonB-dependent receptor [Sphingomonas sp. SUN019]|uniref:TonB-dependent receptor n=1 Tax=Sphingomonas sp. SUN019 TaxID=2937788 RepID=UPI0021641083|nr:TonB-dependent receptor [Sphingomonas sp. SUN019]UVO51615.1 TonB-dependent receptor [Sphingomonas sp. SUN019]